MNNNMMLKMEDITRTFKNGKVQVEALRGIDLDIIEGEFLAIMGPSGSGKSTLMHIMGCLDTPTFGRYTLDGNDIGSLGDRRIINIKNSKVGFVFQSFNLLPYASAFENVELPLIFAGKSSGERREKTEYLLNLMGLVDRMAHRPNELSGGQQQRVAIVRALVNDPRIILADEPTENLDSKAGKEIIDVFIDLWHKGYTIIVNTHDPEISKYCDRVDWQTGSIPEHLKYPVVFHPC